MSIVRPGPVTPALRLMSVLSRPESPDCSVVTVYAEAMNERARRSAGDPPVRWLTAAEVDSWLSLVRLMTWLPWSIDQQLRRDSNLGMVEYQVLARLSNQPGRTLRM